MHCCGNEGQVIELRGGVELLRLVRCSTCQHRQWHLGTVPIAVDAAFAAPRQADHDGLAALLQGWSVLGASA